MNKKTLFLIIFAIIIFTIRLTGINEAMYDDEFNFAYSLTVMDEYGFNHDYPSVQPLNLIYKPFINLFGLQTWVFRLIPFLFGILNTILVYFLVKRNFSKKAAFWATILMLIAFYPTLASLQIDIEGNLIMFSILLMFFAYLEYEKAKNKGAGFFWQILSGIGLGIAVASKYNAVYIIFPIALYSLIKTKSIKQSFNNLFPVYLTGFLLFLSSVLLGIIASPKNWLDFVPILVLFVPGFAGYYHTGSFSPLGITMLVLWSTPLLLGFYFTSFDNWKKNKIFILWITLAILFYTFIMGEGSLDRYFMNLIPAFAILGGITISKINLKKTQLFFSSLMIIFFTAFLFLINSFPLKQVARIPNLYLQELKNLNFNFLFAYTSASGPTFGVSFATIFYSFLLSFFFLLLYLIFKKRSSAKWFFVIFLSISLSFNIFLTTEYLFHPTGTDVSKIKWEMIDYVKENNLNFPIYGTDSGILWHFDNRCWRNCWFIIHVPDNEIGSETEHQIKSIKERGGTLILLNWPPLPDESPALEIVSHCNLKKQFFDKSILVGEVYVC